MILLLIIEHFSINYPFSKNSTYNYFRSLGINSKDSKKYKQELNDLVEGFFDVSVRYGESVDYNKLIRRVEDYINSVEQSVTTETKTMGKNLTQKTKMLMGVKASIYDKANTAEEARDLANAIWESKGEIDKLQLSISGTMGNYVGNIHQYLENIDRWMSRIENVLSFGFEEGQQELKDIYKDLSDLYKSIDAMKKYTKDLDSMAKSYGDMWYKNKMLSKGK